MATQCDTCSFPWGPVIFGFILFLTLHFNVYKLPLTAVAPYNIFPWSQSPQVAKMAPKDLHSHLITGLLLAVVVYLRYLNPDNNYIKLAFIITHIVFTIILLPNLEKFGDFDPHTAFIINGAVLTALNLAFFIGTLGHYILILSLPVFVEVSSWMYVMANLLYFIFTHGPY